ncbi:MAG: molybdenum cofactor biosynthesis protein MoaE [Gemmatimonadota bacterium]|nr:MAG: molybdenum cofactor biosynthesis protein MoaE [Gemmatimonadota bacterium]
MYCVITRDPIDPAGLLRRVRRDVDGAVLIFVGVVRDHHEGRSVEALSYEAFEEMAAERIRAICGEVGDRFEVGELAVAHRVGDLAIGDVSVAIAVAAPHRDAAYKASREIIERIKTEVPIWKRERYSDGEEVWRDGTVPDGPQTG